MQVSFFRLEYIVRKLIYVLAVILGVSGILMIGRYILIQNDAAMLVQDAENSRVYDRHYLFVSSDESQMLQDIFERISDACESSGVYLEWCSKGAPENYTAAECIDISIAMKADGIVVHPDNSLGLEDAIGRAVEAGIPVVTILRDLPDSERVSYIGVSNYQIGELYGGQLLSLMENGENAVCLLIDDGDNANDTQLLYTQMVQAVNNGAPEGKTMVLQTRNIDSRTDFDAEEVIRDVLLGKERPDILICQDIVQTECAIQALIEYNLVGTVSVIGFYVTDTVISALQQDLIPVTMTIDTRTLGESCVQALDEYLELGRVSDYYNISLYGITPTTVDQYLQEASQDIVSEEEL